MAWYLDDVRIFVQEKTNDDKQVIARLTPLANGTVLQVFGYEDTIMKLSALVVGSGDIGKLIAKAKDGVTHTLHYPESVSDAVYVNSLTVKRNKAGFQTIRPDLDCQTQVYTVDLELYV